MAEAEGFRFDKRKNGDVVIFHHGKLATVLRAEKATAFLEEVTTAPETEQAAMARLTGNYRRGNERTAVSHPRNRH